MKFTVNKPSVWMYSTQDLCSEVSDELLFGTVLEIISESDTCAYCRTSYGYRGYINKWELCDCESEDCDDSEKQFVWKRCDLLLSPEYKYAPIMSLPKGSRIKVTEKYNEKFSVCAVGKKQYYISNTVLKRQSLPTFAENFTEIAKSYIGAPYRWGGKSDEGVDCSGLVFMSAWLCGKSIYRDAVPMESYVDKITEAELRKGDLIYFKGHVAIFMGEDKILHSSARFAEVILQSFSESGLEKSDVLCYARIK